MNARRQPWSPAKHGLAVLTRVLCGAADLLQPASSSESEDEDVAEAPAAMGDGAYGNGHADTEGWVQALGVDAAHV